MPATAAPSVTAADSIDPLVVATAAAHASALAARAIAARGRFRIALAGGSTPRALYPHAGRCASTGRGPTSSSATSGRCRPTTRSRTTAWRARRCSTPRASRPANVFRWRAEDPPTWTARRATTSRRCARAAPALARPRAARPRPRRPYRVAVPGHDARWRRTTASAVAVDVPALGTRRLTLTYPAFLDARDVFFLVTGARQGAPRWPTSSAPESALPAARHRPPARAHVPYSAIECRGGLTRI